MKRNLGLAMFLLVSIVVFTKDSCSQTLKYNWKFKNYFGYDTLPPITSEEEKLLISYVAARWGVERCCILPNGDTTAIPLYSNLPIIRGHYNQVWLDSLRGGIDNSPKYKGVDYSDLYNILLVDALIEGEVIDKRSVSEQYPNKCLHYKTELVIKVSDILHSYIDIEIGDYVIVKQRDGTSVGCLPKHSGTGENKVGTKVYQTSSHGNFHVVGEKSLFAIDNSASYSYFFYQIKKSNSNYDDSYCGHCFVLGLGHDGFVERLMDDQEEIKEFFKTVVKEQGIE